MSSFKSRLLNGSKDRNKSPANDTDKWTGIGQKRRLWNFHPWIHLFLEQQTSAMSRLGESAEGQGVRPDEVSYIPGSYANLL